MSQWGVFRDERGDVHVAPVLDDGRIASNHSCNEFCQCRPRLDKADLECEIWVHQDRERGGFNS